MLLKWPDPFPRAIYREKYPYSDLYPEPWDEDRAKFPDVVRLASPRLASALPDLHLSP